jgi:hypothetical protein
MPPKVELIQIRKLSEIVDDSINFLKQNWKPLFKCYFTICGFFWVSGLIIAVFNQTQTFKLQENGESVYSITYCCTLLLGFLNFIFITLTTLCYMVLYHEGNNTPPGVEEVWSYVKYYLLRIVGSSLLLLLLVAAGTICCVIPGIYLAPVCLLIITIMVIENASISYAFNQGFRLIKKNWWETVGALIVMSIIIVAATALLAIPVVVIVVGILSLTAANHSHTISIALSLTLNSLQFLYMLPAIAMALIYYNLNEIKDDNGLMQRIQMFGKQHNTTDHLPTEEY